MSRNALFSPYSFKPDSPGSSNSPGVTFSRMADGPSNPNLSFFGTSSFYSDLSKTFNVSTSQASTNSARMLSQPAPAAPRAPAAGISGAAGLAAVTAQQLGQGIGGVMTANTEAQIQKDYATNAQSHGIGTAINSSLIRENAESIKGSQSAGANIGSLFGPVGALIGHALGGVAPSNPNLLNTASSVSGQFNPSDTGVAAAASTRGATGVSNLVDNVGSTTNV